MSHKPEVAGVPLNLLIVDTAVQRPLDKRKVDKMAAEMNLDAIGLICVSQRDSGAYSIIDGQHRVEALRVCGFVTDPVECEIFRGLTLVEEAIMFRQRNTRAPVQRIDLFKVRVTEGDKAAVWLTDMLNRLGWTIGWGSSEGILSAVDALERVYRLDPEGNPPAIERAVAALTAAWGHANSSVDGPLLAGVGGVFARYGTEVNSGDVIDRLAKFPGGAKALYGKARGLKEMIGGTLPSAVAEIVVESYNKGRRSRALRPWRAE